MAGAATASGWPSDSRDEEALTEADIRIGRELGLDADRTAAEMTYSWGRPLSVERDEIAGVGANAQRRGIVTRELKAQLRKQVTDGND